MRPPPARRSSPSARLLALALLAAPFAAACRSTRCAEPESPPPAELAAQRPEVRYYVIGDA